MTVDEYLNNLPPDQMKLLSSLRNAIRQACPDADEIIGYHMPGYKYMGTPLLYFAAFKKHCSLFGVSKKLIAELKSELSAFEIVNSTIHFTPENPFPAALVKSIVKKRMKEISQSQQIKKKK